MARHLLTICRLVVPPEPADGRLPEAARAGSDPHRCRRNRPANSASDPRQRNSSGGWADKSDMAHLAMTGAGVGFGVYAPHLEENGRVGYTLPFFSVVAQSWRRQAAMARPADPSLFARLPTAGRIAASPYRA
jgi:hypothetical protein